jgi:hypothetical protein
MALRHREIKATRRTRPPTSPSHDDLQIQSIILSYVIGEGDHDKTIFELACLFSPDHRGDAVERSVRDLVGARLLSLDRGKVVPGPASTVE